LRNGRQTWCSSCEPSPSGGDIKGTNLNWIDVTILLVAGILGGLTGSIAGLASVATYPALLAVGLPPVAANVTNTLALVFMGVGSVLGSRPELAGQGVWLRRAAPAAALGGIVGALLLLSTPAGNFEKTVPFLMAIASFAILLPHRRAVGRHTTGRTAAVLATEGAGIVLITIYGGYFGAAAGVLTLALILYTSGATLAHANAAKNFLMAVNNTAASVVFAVLAPVHWMAVVPLGAGCLIGSRLGPIVVRHAPATVVRVVIGVAGLALAVKLGIDAF
jgi:uncharacterized membrane protein YfcA